MPYIFEYNAGIVAGIVCTVFVMILVLLVTFICRKTKPRYEFLALTPKALQRQQQQQNGGGGANPANSAPQGRGGRKLLGFVLCKIYSLFKSLVHRSFAKCFSENSYGVYFLPGLYGTPPALGNL